MLNRSLHRGRFGHDNPASRVTKPGRPGSRRRGRGGFQANGAGAASEAPRGQAGAISAWNDAGPPTSGQQTMIVANPGPPAGGARTRPQATTRLPPATSLC